MAWYRYGFPKSMTVGERRAKALRAAEKLGRKQKLDPVTLEGRQASTWWGRAWNQNLEGYADYSNRLPRGRSYARNGSVIDLRIEAGTVTALVQGSRSTPYQVKVDIDPVNPAARKALTEACSGKLASAEALLGGLFPEDMQRLLTAEKTGLFPHPRAIRFSCSCPDSAALCKHIAAALYGVGARLDRDPSLFFLLRKIEIEALVSCAVKEQARKLLQSEGTGESKRLDTDKAGLGALFGIELDSAGKPGAAPSVPVVIPVAVSGKKGAPRGGGLRGGGGRRSGDGAGKKGRGSEAAREKIQSAMGSIEPLAAELADLEAYLKTLLTPRRSRNSQAR